MTVASAKARESMRLVLWLRQSPAVAEYGGREGSELSWT